MVARIILSLACTLLLTGCITNPTVPQRPARISHVVFVKLIDPAEGAALITDADQKLGRIPSLTSYAAGPPLELGRPEVDGDFDVGLYMGFLTLRDYQAYLSHPDHVEFVQRWKPRCQWLRIHDFVDDTP